MDTQNKKTLSVGLPGKSDMDSCYCGCDLSQTFPCSGHQSKHHHTLMDAVYAPRISYNHKKLYH